ncbi:GntR family transcriptional regulator [Hypericibacter adhaerens]|jgi:DNA-binding GntR family transcriptional regulator|uniref:GntR family transcriptional regulator n=1 Tax=Hypericibacter adhaerens TaxID=2602016 RepID=A0A5J6N4E1_9PROT|nr:GntR family transcriptional regulator [Hypericibacter adhaerens]QEX24699.1 GntR family transcriptional regulator [Hypericibacter adhaerens]
MPDLLGGLINGPMATRTSEGIAHVIRRAILAGILTPGQPLRERQLAEELGVSRTPIREAFFILQGEGLVDLVPSRYARVRHVSSNDIAQIYSLRRVLESYAVRCAAEQQDTAKLNQAADALAVQIRIGTSGSAIDQAQADLAFHEAVAAAAGSQLLLTIVHQVLAVTVTLRSRYKYSPTRVKQVCREHEAIFDAIRAGDPDAAEALMEEHIQGSSKLAFKHLQKMEKAEDAESGEGMPSLHRRAGERA